MPLLRLKLADLHTLSAPSSEGIGGDGGPDGTADLEVRIRRQFRFLPDPITVKVEVEGEGDEVIVVFPEEKPGSRAEASRLAEKAGKRASEGNFGKAIDIYQRVLELQPSFHRARRDLAMIYAGGKNDSETAEKFIPKALEQNPQDPWALNSLATFTQKAGRSEETLVLFEQAIEVLEVKQVKAHLMKQGMMQELLTVKTRLV